MFTNERLLKINYGMFLLYNNNGRNKKLYGIIYLLVVQLQHAY